MSENARNVSRHLHEAVQATVDIDTDLPDGSMLAGWLTIAEWMAPDGKRWLTTVDGSAQPGEGLPPWQADGYLHNRLFDASGFIQDDEAEQ